VTDIVILSNYKHRFFFMYQYTVTEQCMIIFLHFIAKYMHFNYEVIASRSKCFKVCLQFIK